MCDEERVLSNKTKNMSIEHKQNSSIVPENKTCRACLTQNKDMLFLFPDQECYDDTNSQNELLEMFTSLTALIANPDDPYPKHICNECLNKLYEAYNFWKMCRDSVDIIDKLNDGKIDIDIKEGYDYSCHQCDADDSASNISFDFHNDSHVLHSNSLTGDGHQEFPVLNSKIDECTAQSNDTEKCYLFSKLETNTGNILKDEHEQIKNSSEELLNKKINFCQDCNLSFKTKCAYVKHNREYHKERKKCSKCTKCKLSFPTKNERDKHWKQTHQIIKKEKNSEKKSEKKIKVQNKFHCIRCQLDFTSYSKFRIHRETVHSVKTLYCKICHLAFDTRSEYENHTKIHLQYLCSQCGYTTHRMARLRIHFSTHSDAKLYQCSTCDNQFKSKNSLIVHKRTHSGKGPKYPCPHCDRVFAIWGTRSEHIQRDHTASYKFICNICSKGFLRDRRLKEHMRTHTGEKPFPCEVCSVKFRCKRTLKMHMSTHSDSREHPCEVCEKRFKLRKHLVQHMVTHSGERKHKCEICQKSFTQAHVLRSHMKTHDKAT